MENALSWLKKFPNKLPVIAHSHYGDGRKENRPPENTVSAFIQTVKENPDVVEIDIQVTRDGEFVIIHDGDVYRATGKTGRVDQMTLSEVKELVASYGREEYKSERIPTFNEMVAVIPKDKGFLLEIKSDMFLREDIAKRFVQDLKKLDILGRTAIVSFSLERLMAIKKVGMNIPVGLITKPSLRFFFPKKGVEMLGPAWPILFINPFYAWLAHRKGQIVCPLDPSPEKRLWFYRLMHCDALLSNNPRKTVKKLGK